LVSVDILRYGFHEELLTKYGDFVGPLIWKEICDVFDMLPLTAVVDQEVPNSEISDEFSDLLCFIWTVSM
jgi:diadenosine tetraphosphatase ApaH/serine/threonine PP2A family protein phosphatase